MSKIHGWWGWLRLAAFGLVLAGVTGAMMALPLLATDRVILEEGEVATEDVRAPRSFAYESEILREQAQEQAVAGVAPIYTPPDPSRARQQLGRARQVFDYLGSVRADPLASPAQKRGWILAVPELADLSSDTIDALLSLSAASWNRVQQEALSVIDQVMRSEIREGHLDEALEEVPARVSLDLSDEESAVAVALAQHFVVPNSFLDPIATAEAKTRAREEVPAAIRTFESGQIIVREGERVTALDIEALDQLGLRQPQVRWQDFVGPGLVAVLETVLLGLYLARFRPEVLWEWQQSLLLLLLLSSTIALAGLMLRGGLVLRYLAPLPMLALVATATLGQPTGVAAAVFVGIAAGMLGDKPMELVAYVTFGGLVAGLTLGPVKRIGALFRSGLFVALANLLVIAAFWLPQEHFQPGDLVAAVLSGAINGGVSSSLALGLLFVIGPLFDITTTMRLIELSRPDHPLLQRLLREAPATYHHSLMVANLAEQAAERIGADALLTRVGAYYHDVGKIIRPYFFTENQVEGLNPHDSLDPRTSAEVIIGHVRDGLELARKYRLPSRVRAFIPEHHGTARIGFFYHKAVQMAGGDPSQVDESAYRHIGPKPQSRETALVMLADGCEAAVRSARPTSAEEIAEIVGRIIDSRVADGQLDECDLTLHDLAVVRETFISALKGVFHPRIKYPEPVRDEKPAPAAEQEGEQVAHDRDSS